METEHPIIVYAVTVSWPVYQSVFNE